MKKSVFIASFSHLERAGWYCPQLVSFLLAAQTRSAAEGRGLIHLQVRNCRQIDASRNFAVSEFLKSESDWLLFTDNDMAPPLNLLEMIDAADSRVDVVVPMFYGVTDEGLCLIWKPLPTENVNSGAEWIGLEVAGTGAMAVRRRVCETLKTPWFKTLFSQEDGRILKGEDFSFCDKSRKAGFRIFGNVRFSAEHFHTVGLTFAHNAGARSQTAGK